MTVSTSEHAISLAAELVSAYVSRNSVPVGELPGLIRSVSDALVALSKPTEAVPEQRPLRPAVPVKNSVQEDHIVCLEDGRRFKSLKRHLMAVHGTNPEEYRAKWGLPSTYPMVAPAYTKERSTLALKLGLGRRVVDGSVGVDVGDRGRREADEVA